MNKFKSYLIEEEEGSKLKHIEHLEDHIINDGREGFDHALGVMNQAHAHIKSGKTDASLTMKHDGSPSIVYGHHPSNGKFFVASKSAFNVTPKINYTDQDIEKNHGHAPGLVDKLKDALHHLKKVAPKQGVYQGDVMFSGKDKKERDGKVEFKPNTITYSAAKDSEEGKKIKKAKFGLYTHTQYHGDTAESMHAHFNPDFSQFKEHPDVYHRLPGHDTSKSKLTPADEKEMKHHMDIAKDLHIKHGNRMYSAIEPHKEFIKKYINSTVRTGEDPGVAGLKTHIQNHFIKEMGKVKTPAAKAKKDEEKNAHLKYIDSHRGDYTHFLDTHHHLQQAKNVLVNALARHTGGLEHHVNDSPVKPEGFVVTHKGKVTKLNDRKEFNRLNFLARPR